MSHSSIAKKIDGLLIKLKTENHSRDSDPIPRTMDIAHTPSRRNRPTLGNLNSNNTRKEKLTLPVSYERRNDHSIETDKKLKEIKEINGILTINGEEYRTDIADMEDIGELGKGTCGQVFKMRHKPSGAIIAVKKMRRSGNCEENKRIIMDIDVALKSHDCPFIVQCLGCFITDSEVWICMELMATCFDKLLKRLEVSIPEDVLGKVTFATVKALSYLKEKHDVIHRDVKPSNILVDERGNVKLCDFGISGRLVDSIANTRSAGCAAYMAPERIDPSKREYDIRADVWSLGITLVELATSVSPYEDCKTDFEVLAKVLHEAPPSLPNDKKYTDEFRAFVACCLIKDHEKRPKYVQLLQEPFVKRYENMTENVYEWFKCALRQPDLLGANSPGRRYTPAPPSTNSISIQRRQHPHQHQHQHRSLLDSHQQKIQQQQQQLSNGGSNLTPLSVPLSIPLSIPIDRLPPDGRNNFSPKHQREPFNIFQQQPQQPDKPNQTVPEATSGRFSPFPRRLGESPPPDPGWFSPMARRRHGHGHVHGHGYGHPDESRFDNQNITPVSSPYQQRRCTNNLSERLVQDGFWSSPASSPLPIRKHYQNAPAMEQQFCTSSNTSPILLQRFFHQQKQLQQQQHQQQQPPVVTTVVGEDTGLDENSTKKRYASHIKFQLVGDRMKSSRYQSPEPPPRLSRGSSQENSFSSSSQSPLAARRNFLEAASSTSASPSLSRRYISPSPPQPPPRRLSESSSVPGSPQHQHFRARFHYTPEPQRRIFNNTDVS